MSKSSASKTEKLFNRDYRLRCNIGGAAMCKASIAAVVLALGIASLVQEGTKAMVAPPAGLRPALTMPAVETVALRKSVTVTRHVAVRRGVSVRARHVVVRHRGVARTRHVEPDIEALGSEPGTSHFDIEESQPVGPMSQWAGAAPWP